MYYVQNFPVKLFRWSRSSSAASQNQSNQIADEPTDISRKGEEKIVQNFVGYKFKKQENGKQIGLTNITGSNIQNKKKQRFAMLALQFAIDHVSDVFLCHRLQQLANGNIERQRIEKTHS